MRSVSFIHKWDATAASFRYRAQIPAHELGASLNDPSADILVYAKPLPSELDEIRDLKDKAVIVDVCNDYTGKKWFTDILKEADEVTCSSWELMARLGSLGFPATLIHDPYEFEQADPHCHGDKLLWFGHSSNIYTLEGKKILHPLRIVSNHPGTIPWSIETVLTEMATADIVILPETSRFASANRAVESIRRGCFVVAEPHPALTEIPGIWTGDLEEGIQWAMAHEKEANARTREAQIWVAEYRSPQRIGHEWHIVTERLIRAAA